MSNPFAVIMDNAQFHLAETHTLDDVIQVKCQDPNKLNDIMGLSIEKKEVTRHYSGVTSRGEMGHLLIPIFHPSLKNSELLDCFKEYQLQ